MTMATAHAPRIAGAHLGVTRLRCEYRCNPIGIDVRWPRLSWQIQSDGRGIMQAAFQVQAADSCGDLEAEHNLLWDTGKVLSDQSVHVPFAGPTLRSMQRCYWRVRAWDNGDRVTGWSTPAFWELGLLDASDWRGRWIEPGFDIDPKVSQPCPHLRTRFTLCGGIRTARVYITAHGLYELTINGQPVTEDIFTPGYTAYHKRLQYQVYDVAGLLQNGSNVASVILGDGWWRGKIGASSVRNTYGERVGLLMQLRVVYEDGSEQWVISDENWRGATGPILASDLKDGELYNAGLEMPGWDKPGFDDGAWRGVKVANYGYANLVASNSVPVRRQEEFRPVRVIQTPAGETVVDMGQNFAGRVRLKVTGKAGTTITMQHGETLDKDGNFTMKNLELAGPGGGPLFQRVKYTLKGNGVEVYEPRFTFHGFRYVKVEGFPGELTPDNLTGVAIYSDMLPTGAFTCSDPLVDRLQHNITWSQKSNFLDIPTDCPQRERAGWTGDAQIFVRTGSFNMDTAAFFTRWLKDLAAEQRGDGMVTNLVPNAFTKASIVSKLEGSAGWGDAAVIVPWTLYLCYGDRRILEEQYPSAKAWVDYMRGRAATSHWARRLEPSYWLNKKRRARQRYIWDTNYQWGEWLEPDTSELAMSAGVIKRVIFGEPAVATMYLSYSSGLLSQMARLLGKSADAAIYAELHDRARDAWVAEFVRPNGRIKPDRQASYVRALAFDLLPEDLRPAASQRLVELIRANGNHLGTGFLSTVYLCHVLTRFGHLDVAYDLLNQKTVPSWLYPITKGATTIWETWDGVKPDGSVSLSLNHYSLGAIGSWLYQGVAGLELDPECPGYRRFLVQPHPGGGLTRAQATYESAYGTIIAGWEDANGCRTVAVTVPANTTATVRLPNAKPPNITESGWPLSRAAGVTNVRGANGDILLEIGSGEYYFEYPL
jgi:alpha-L-rhamnosidase